MTTEGTSEDPPVDIVDLLRRGPEGVGWSCDFASESDVLDQAADEIERLRLIVHADPLSRMHMLDQAHQDIRYLCEQANSSESPMAGTPCPGCGGQGVVDVGHHSAPPVLIPCPRPDHAASSSTCTETPS